MQDSHEKLKQMLQDIINDDTAGAEAAIHDYIVAKTQQVMAGANQDTAKFDFDSEVE